MERFKKIERGLNFLQKVLGSCNKPDAFTSPDRYNLILHKARLRKQNISEFPVIEQHRIHLIWSCLEIILDMKMFNRDNIQE